MYITVLVLRSLDCIYNEADLACRFNTIGPILSACTIGSQCDSRAPHSYFTQDSWERYACAVYYPSNQSAIQSTLGFLHLVPLHMLNLYCSLQIES